MDEDEWDIVINQIATLHLCNGHLTPITLSYDSWDVGIVIDQIEDQSHPAIVEMQTNLDKLMTFNEDSYYYFNAPDKLVVRSVECLRRDTPL